MEERKQQFVKDIEVARRDGTLDQFYEKYAELYDEIMSSTGYEEILGYSTTLLKSHVTIPDPLVLDVGCGTGFSGVFMNRAGFHNVHGTDPSPNSLKEAEKKGVYSRVFEGLITDTNKLDCADDTYDAVVCIGTITKGHLELRPALKEFARVTKRGGFLLFTIRNDKLDQVDMMAAMGEWMNEGKLELVSIENKKYFVDAFCICCVFKVL